MIMGEAALIKGLLFTGLVWVLLFVAIFSPLRLLLKRLCANMTERKTQKSEISQRRMRTNIVYQ